MCVKKLRTNLYDYVLYKYKNEEYKIYFLITYSYFFLEPPPPESVVSPPASFAAFFAAIFAWRAKASFSLLFCGSPSTDCPFAACLLAAKYKVVDIIKLYSNKS